MTAPTAGQDVRSDIADISAVLVRYATGIDRRDWKLLRTCFTDACEADYGDIGRWLDADALTAYMEHAHARCGHLMHRVTNTEVTLDGDTATARSYCDAFVLGPDNDDGMQASGRFDDDLVRTDQGWKITRRRYTLALLRPVRNSARLLGGSGGSGDSHEPR
ncbi:nuclear transport factor 2 family protein [Streptomyces sp. NPDC046909]|uniref:nuclear transport factor 2 family protein n=1 Tax=Streptomyces sp. NPDC046909 TaxID=3155617 RepID=UPI0033FE516F